MSNTARRIRDYFYRHRRSFAGGMVFLVLTQGFALSVPRLLRIATDGLVARDFDRVTFAAIVLVAVAFVGACTRIVSRILIFNSGRHVEFDIRNDLFDHLTRLSPSFYGAMPTGQIMSRAVNDLSQVRLLLGAGVLNLTNTLLVYAVVVPLLFASDAELAAYSLSAIPLLVIIGRWTGRKIYHFGLATQESLGTLSSKVQENLGGTLTVRVFGREGAETRRFDALNRHYYGLTLQLARLRAVLFPIMGLFGSVGAMVLLYFGGQRMISGRMSVGQFVEFNAYLAALTWPTIALGWMISLVQRGLGAMDRINEIFAAVPSITGGTSTTRPREPRIEIRNLTFTYPHAERPTLRNLSATFEPGETVIIVGRTASGKTTLLRAIARLLEIPAGHVFLGGIDAVDLSLEAHRSMVAYAPQEAFLFSRTIAENVTFGEPEASDDDVRVAVRKAGLLPDLQNFPNGIDTLVGERGVTLSGGQRQRTALARALLTHAPILLLDDTLAAVDTETESRILAELRQHTGRTTIMVTHRFACAAMADRILVVEDGEIVEQGTEVELLEKDGIYREMHQRQRLYEAIESTARESKARAQP